MSDRQTRVKEALRGLYPILDVSADADPRALLARARAIAIPGVRVMQVRAKGVSDSLFYEVASSVAAVCRSMAVALVINDRVDVAMAVGAAGVHLGSGDLPLSAARRILPASMFVGRSTDSPEEAKDAADAGADYIAWGACFPTATKPDAAAQEGPSALARVRAAIPRVPLVAIGGITAENLPLVAAAGADAFAVIAALRDAIDPAAEARHLVTVFAQSRSS